MRKRVDHDATQEVSSSQLVPDAKPPAFSGPKNDASMWMQAPVSVDDFVGAAKKKPARSARGLVIGLTVVGLVAVTGAGVWYAFLREPTATSASSSAGSAASASPAPAAARPAVATAASDAGVTAVAATADAAVAATDAGVAALGALQVDAVSAADPAVKKPAKKRAPTKKRTTKKKKPAPKR